MKRIILLAMLMIANISVAMDYDIGAKLLKATGEALYNDLDRLGLAKDYTHSFIQKIENKANANYDQALEYGENFLRQDGRVSLWQCLRWCFSRERREFVRDLRSNHQEFLSQVTGLAFSYPVWLPDEECAFFVNTAYDRKQRGEFKPIELYYAHMICPESAKKEAYDFCERQHVCINSGDIITPEVIRKWQYIQEIPK